MEDKPILIISDPDLLPFCFLHNHFNIKMIVDNENWNSVTQYIYTNLIPKEFPEYRELIKTCPVKDTYRLFLHYSEIIYNKTIIELLQNLLEERYKNQEYADYLLNTGTARLVYEHFNDDFLGVGVSGNGLNILGKILHNIRFKLHQKNAESLYNVYICYKILENVMLNGDDLRFYQFNDNIDTNKYFEEIIKTYGVENVKTKLLINYDDLNDKELNYILRKAHINIGVLFSYVIKKNIKTYQIKVADKIKNKIFDEYKIYLLKNLTEEEKIQMENEFNYINIDEMKSIIVQLSIDNYLPKDLMDKFEQDIIAVSDAEVKKYENLNIDDMEPKNIKKDVNLSDFKFSDEDQYLTIRDESSNPIILYLQKMLTDFLPDSPYVNMDKYIKAKEQLAMKILNVKYGFTLENNDLQYILSLTKDLDVIFENDDVNLGYILDENYGENFVGTYIMTHNQKTQYNNENDNDIEYLVENSVIMMKWIENQAIFLCSIIYNLKSDSADSIIKIINVMFPSGFLFDNLFKHNIRKPNFFISILAIYNLNDDEIVDLLWNYIIFNINLMNTDIKSTLCKMQYILSSEPVYKKIINKNIDHILYAIVNVINKIKKLKLKIDMNIVINIMLRQFDVENNLENNLDKNLDKNLYDGKDEKDKYEMKNVSVNRSSDTFYICILKMIKNQSFKSIITSLIVKTGYKEKITDDVYKDEELILLIKKMISKKADYRLNQIYDNFENLISIYIKLDSNIKKYKKNPNKLDNILTYLLTKNPDYLIDIDVEEHKEEHKEEYTGKLREEIMKKLDGDNEENSTIIGRILKLTDNPIYNKDKIFDLLQEYNKINIENINTMIKCLSKSISETFTKYFNEKSKLDDNTKKMFIKKIKENIMSSKYVSEIEVDIMKTILNEQNIKLVILNSFDKESSKIFDKNNGKFIESNTIYLLNNDKKYENIEIIDLKKDISGKNITTTTGVKKSDNITKLPEVQKEPNRIEEYSIDELANQLIDEDIIEMKEFYKIEESDKRTKFLIDEFLKLNNIDIDVNIIIKSINIINESPISENIKRCRINFFVLQEINAFNF